MVENYRPPAEWPSSGQIEVKDLRVRYAPDLPEVIRGISFACEPGNRGGGGLSCMVMEG